MMSKNTKAALWMGGPWVILVVSLIAFAVVGRFVVMLAAGNQEKAIGIIRFANVLLGGTSILSILMVPVGLVVGIVILARSKSQS